MHIELKVYEIDAKSADPFAPLFARLLAWHTITCSALLALLARSAVLLRSPVRSSWEIYVMN